MAAPPSKPSPPRGTWTNRPEGEGSRGLAPADRRDAIAAGISAAYAPRARAHRLAPRYPVDTSVRVFNPADGAGSVYAVRDVSEGGLFLISPNALELFCEIQVMLPGLTERAVCARVVHVVSSAKADATGIGAGMGVQFEPNTPDEHAAIQAFVEAARRQDPRARWPIPRDKADRGGAESDPMLGYLLKSIDGTRGPEDLAELLALELDSTEAMLRQLVALGVIVLVRAAEVTLPAAAAPPRPALPATATAVAAGARRPRRGLQRTLDPEAQAELRELWVRIADLDHYQVLGLARSASREQVRQAFFELSRRFHPDAYYGAALGEDLHKLERVFARLSEAYGVLGRDGTRAEYDHYLDQRAALRGAVPQPTAAGDPSALPSPPAAGLVPELMFRSTATATPSLSGRPAARLLWDALRNSRANRALVFELSDQAAYEEKHQRWAEAANTWLRVCQASPDDPAAHVRAALALQHAGDPPRARAAARRAVELAPQNAQARRTLGHLYLAAGMKHRARIELEATLRLQSATPTVPAPILLG